MATYHVKVCFSDGTTSKVKVRNPKRIRVGHYYNSAGNNFELLVFIEKSNPGSHVTWKGLSNMSWISLTDNLMVLGIDDKPLMKNRVFIDRILIEKRWESGIKKTCLEPDRYTAGFDTTEGKLCPYQTDRYLEENTAILLELVAPRGWDIF